MQKADQSYKAKAMSVFDQMPGFLSVGPNAGLSMNEERKYVKCYMGDTGLLVSHAFDENEKRERTYTGRFCATDFP